MRKYLLAGLAILLPVILTAMIVVFLFNLFTTPFVPLVRAGLEPLKLPPHSILLLSRVIGLVLLCVLILLLGMLAQRFFFKQLASFWHRLIDRIPFVGTVYRGCRDIFKALFAPDGKQAFKESVLIPFPNRSYFAAGFTAGDVAKECQEKISEPLVTVFMPTAPHPISGFLFLVPKKDVYRIDMTKEDVVKYLISCGVVHPEKK
jgi:uncharacterized membrane protein